jgi:hypothetical protein
MDQKERTAIASGLPEVALVLRARLVAGREIGNPLLSNIDSVSLREQFGLTVEHNYHSTWVFNDEVQACWGHKFSTPQEAARRATLIAVAALWKPKEESK